MAEILLSLTIIGVVAAITLPSLTGNINERTWNTQRKALYARMSQAIALMPAINGYGTLTEDENHSVTADTAAETFVTEGLSKVLKINNICDSDHLADCGIPSTITPLDGSSAVKLSDISTFLDLCYAMDFSDPHWSYSQINTKTAAFETVNGESILTYYNPYCAGIQTEVYAQPLICANFVYDLNGNKGPNTVGKDIGVMTALYPSDTVLVAPQPLQRNASSSSKWEDASKLCTTQDAESRLPNIDELSAMFANNKLFKIQTGVAYWSGTVDSSVKAWHHGLGSGERRSVLKTTSDVVRCVKR